jgi:hypothetical protein
MDVSVEKVIALVWTECRAFPDEAFDKAIVTTWDKMPPPQLESERASTPAEKAVQALAPVAPSPLVP